MQKKNQEKEGREMQEQNGRPERVREMWRRGEVETWPDHLLLKPQREVGGVSDHRQQIG